MSSLNRGPDKYSRADIRNRARRARIGALMTEKEQLRFALSVLEEIGGLCDRLDDAEALLEGGGR